MDLANLLNWRVWLNTNPGALLPSSIKIMFGIFIALVVILIVLKIVGKSKKFSKTRRVVFKKFYTAFFWLTLVYLILFFFAREGLPIFGMRLWFLLLFAAGVIWSILIIRYAVREVPKKEQEKMAQEKFEKYLPKKKK